MVGAVVGWFLYPYIFTFLTDPLHSANKHAIIIAGSPIAPLLTRIKIAGYVGIILAMPVLLWQLWRFITPGLYPHEKKYAVPFTAGAVVFFVLGAAVAYVSLLPTLDLPQRGGRLEHQAGLQHQRLPQAGRADDHHLRHRLRVPGAAGGPRDRRGGHARPSSATPAAGPSWASWSCRP